MPLGQAAIRRGSDDDLAKNTQSMVNHLNTSKTILVTGANGFIGRALVKSLCEQGYRVRATVRSDAAFACLSSDASTYQLIHLTIYNLGELTDTTDWREALNHVDTVIHCAARAHVLRETSADPLETFRRVNTRVTARLAEQACEMKVRRFIFLSSIGVLGRSTQMTPFTDQSIPNPQQPYAQAKWEAEQCLHAMPNSMEQIIIRPPLIYGPGMKGNFALLTSFIRKHIPMPLGAIHNKRQFLGINNLVDFIMTCLQSEKTIHDTFLIADKEVVSTTELLNTLAATLGKKSILLPVPSPLLNWVLKTIGKDKLAEQLLGNLEIQSIKALDQLGWEPPYTMAEQLG